jgi:16S rRNA (adenine1518-N6/adenine1519-N6)-dimethyltransferase
VAQSENPYLALPRIRAALRALDLRPTRGMGQNFLLDPAALEQIVGAAALTGAETVVEVGPGFGVLTWELVRRARQVVAVELDRRLGARLAEEFASAPNLAIVPGDILRLPPPELLAAAPLGDPLPYRLISNLPYAITSPVLRHFLEPEPRPELIVVLVQWEVAERIAARPGDLSVLAHSVQIYAEPEIIARVPAGSFFPAPAVDSAVLRLRVRPRPAGDVEDPEQLMRVIKAGFLHARKTLSNALPGGLAAMGRRTTREEVLAALEVAGVDPQRRAETVTLTEWSAVYRALARP